MASSSGRLWHWHCTSGKTIGAPVVEPGNQILACDVRGDGETFATAGYDGTIRVYDEATRELRASVRGWSAGEDPATGAAAAALGGLLRDRGHLTAPADLVVHQGVDMGRPSLLAVHIPEEGGIKVGGTAALLS